MSLNKNLTTIAKNHKTDKYEHGYTTVYENYFESLRDKNLRILEIGIADGKSLLTWSEYFKNSTIIGIDIHKIDLKEKNLEHVILKFIKVHKAMKNL